MLWREVEKLYFVCFNHDKFYVIRSRGRSKYFIRNIEFMVSEKLCNFIK